MTEGTETPTEGVTRPWDRQTFPEKGQPHGWIQWKGTGVCMDVHCACGKLTHVDAEFAYHVRCGACGRVYFCNGHIELVPLDEGEISQAGSIVTTDVFEDEWGV